MSSSKKSGMWFPFVLVSGLLLLFYVRLIPFQFAWVGTIPLERVLWEPLSIFDIPINILLILPFGFGLAGTLARAGWSPRAVFWGTIGIGALLSLALEFTQIFIPERVPSVADILANTAGLAAGYGLFRAWEMGWGNTMDRLVTRRNLLIGLTIYAAFFLGLTLYLYRIAGLSHWDSRYPLLIGNEATGERQWDGQVDDLFFLDRALSAAEAAAALDGSLPADLLAYYPFDGPAPFADRQGNLPALGWQGEQAAAGSEFGVMIGPAQWLMTGDPVEILVDRLRSSNALTVGLTVATDDPIQRGPARIVSISVDNKHRNLLLGHQVDGLLIRLRTASTGDNGERPQLRVPEVFTDGAGPVRLFVTYDRPMLRAYLANKPATTYAISLAPGLAFFSDLPRLNLHVVEMTGNPHRYDIGYWLIVFGLAGSLTGGLALAKVLVRRRRASENVQQSG